MRYHCWALRWTTATDREILFLPLCFALPCHAHAMFPRQSDLRTPLLSLLIHSRLETWTQTQLHTVYAAAQCLFSGFIWAAYFQSHGAIFSVYFGREVGWSFLDTYSWTFSFSRRGKMWRCCQDVSNNFLITIHHSTQKVSKGFQCFWSRSSSPCGFQTYCSLCR